MAAIEPLFLFIFDINHIQNFSCGVEISLMIPKSVINDMTIIYVYEKYNMWPTSPTYAVIWGHRVQGGDFSFGPISLFISYNYNYLLSDVP